MLAHALPKGSDGVAPTTCRFYLTSQRMDIKALAIRVWLSAHIVHIAPHSKHTFAISRRDAPELCPNIPPPWRAWGMPGARCTRGLVCTLYW